MDPPHSPGRRRTHGSATRLECVERRLEAAEIRLERLQNTLDGLARSSGVSIGCPCNRCGRSYVLIEGGRIRCPECRFSQSV
ncbi:hypothetical protein GRS80_12985 [Natrialba sp. INN-245]|nr:hypothetical protein [Natrialba sp. INN-245]MWV40640.1 hypothetical protein [Natrialba sp. INN-245]